MQEQVVTAVGPKKTKAKRTATSRKPATSVIVAVSNFQDELAGANRALVESLSRLKGQFEVIYVDDGSRDRSWEVLKGIAKQDKRVRLVRLRSSFGEAAAFDAGFKQSRGKNIVFFTTRVRIDASQIDGLVRKLEQGCDLVMGWRHPRKDWPLNQTIS
ncbi:MAG: glycosyltransferase, partial [Calditrichaeota bacterium]